MTQKPIILVLEDALGNITVHSSCEADIKVVRQKAGAINEFSAVPARDFVNGLYRYREIILRMDADISTPTPELLRFLAEGLPSPSELASQDLYTLAYLSLTDLLMFKGISQPEESTEAKYSEFIASAWETLIRQNRTDPRFIGFAIKPEVIRAGVSKMEEFDLSLVLHCLMVETGRTRTEKGTELILASAFLLRLAMGTSVFSQASDPINLAEAVQHLFLHEVSVQTSLSRWEEFLSQGLEANSREYEGCLNEIMPFFTAAVTILREGLSQIPFIEDLEPEKLWGLEPVADTRRKIEALQERFPVIQNEFWPLFTETIHLLARDWLDRSRLTSLAK
jgi:hypothetical protein